MSAAHQELVHLLNEWAALGNVLLSRDHLVQLSTQVVEAVNASERDERRRFVRMWTDRPEAFEAVAEEYERTLRLLPEAHVAQWKAAVGLETHDDKVKGEDDQDMQDVGGD